ncbi:hypothetical protein FQA39_LY08190 [Lamprigera yunnana]|nr:hypothetical protein FQA39_LY08190 [Lamprigera yunnana]
MKIDESVKIVIIFAGVAAVTSTNISRILSKDEFDNLLLGRQYNQSNDVSFASEYVTKEVLDQIPYDNGENFGDLVFSNRVKGDVLLIRDTILNELMSYDEIRVVWQGQFPAQITAVRALNFGRQRGQAAQIIVSHTNGQVQAFIRIPPQQSVRMFIEVYGRRETRATKGKGETRGKRGRNGRRRRRGTRGTRGGIERRGRTDEEEEEEEEEK